MYSTLLTENKYLRKISENVIASFNNKNNNLKNSQNPNNFLTDNYNQFITSYNEKENNPKLETSVNNNLNLEEYEYDFSQISGVYSKKNYYNKKDKLNNSNNYGYDSILGTINKSISNSTLQNKNSKLILNNSFQDEMDVLNLTLKNMNKTMKKNKNNENPLNNSNFNIELNSSYSKINNNKTNMSNLSSNTNSKSILTPVINIQELQSEENFNEFKNNLIWNKIIYIMKIYSK